MKRLKFSVILLAALALMSSCSIFKKGRSSQPQTVDINAAFKRTYEAIQLAIAKADLKQYKLETIDLTFSTVKTVTTEGEIKLGVVSGKYGRSRSSTTKTTYTFGDMSAAYAKKLTQNDKDAFFIDYMTLSLESVKTIKPIDNFGLSEFEIEVEFSIKNAVEGGLDFDITPVTGALTAGWEKETIHTITIKFTK